MPSLWQAWREREIATANCKLWTANCEIFNCELLDTWNCELQNVRYLPKCKATQDLSNNMCVLFIVINSNDKEIYQQYLHVFFLIFFFLCYWLWNRNQQIYTVRHAHRPIYPSFVVGETHSSTYDSCQHVECQTLAILCFLSLVMCHLEVTIPSLG